MLEGAAEWTQAELLLYLVGHLRGRSFWEWNLIQAEDCKDYSTAVQSLRERRDPGHRTLAAQAFRHTRQKKTEAVADFIGHLERTFQLAYGTPCPLRHSRCCSMDNFERVCTTISGGALLSHVP